MPPAEPSAAVPLIVFALVSLAAGGAFACGPRAKNAPTDAAEPTANHVSRSMGATGRTLAWMLAAPGVWLFAIWAADARVSSPRGIAAGLLVGALIAAACLRLARVRMDA